MRKLLILALTVFLAAPAFAALAAPGSEGAPTGFNGPFSGAAADIVSGAQTLEAGAPVVLTGNITSRIAGSKDKYVFKDETGEVKVDIDDKLLRNVSINPETKVRISGRVDKEFGKTNISVDVKTLEIVQ